MRNTFGSISEISGNILYLDGREPRFGPIEPDIASSLVFKKNDAVYVLDTGCGTVFRSLLRKAVERFRPFSSLRILNSHSHPDHTANNGILREIPCSDVKHYILSRGIPNLEYVRYFSDLAISMEKWCGIADIAPFPWSLFLLPWKVRRRLLPKHYERFFRSNLRKFHPQDSSPSTAEPFENLPRVTPALPGFSGKTVYNLEDAVWIVPTRGHSPDHATFFFPDSKLLYTGDETFDVYPLWPDADGAAVEAGIAWFKELNDLGSIRLHLDAHHHGARTGGRPLADFLANLRANHDDFEREFREAVAEGGDGFDVNAVYRRMRRRPRVPGTEAYFRLEFPRMPVYLKVVMASMIIERHSDLKKDGRNEGQLSVSPQ